MSIIRVGLAETKNYSEGYEAIFGKKEEAQEKKEENKPETNQSQAQKEEAKK